MFTEDEIQFSKDWIKVIYDLKRSIDNWAFNNLQDIWENKFQPSFMQFLLLIEPEGNTNAQLAKMSGISKQAMSKIVLQLQEMDLITTSQLEKDKRSSIINLTPKGKNVINESLLKFTSLISNYKEHTEPQNIETSKHTLEIAKFLIQNFKK